MAETTADVRRDIELTRNRISDTLSELENKMKVTQLVKENPWPGQASCKRNITDITTATQAMMMAVTRNCLLIILWSCEKTYFEMKLSSWW